jgi:light-regulated signal transduction histidine kinase (bacteriophytochrome)
MVTSIATAMVAREPERRLKTESGFRRCSVNAGILSACAVVEAVRMLLAVKARSREAGGAGLGLSLARWIAHVRYGTIGVDRTIGESSSFEVRPPAPPIMERSA